VGKVAVDGRFWAKPDETVWSSAVGWGGGTRDAALELPAVLAETIRDLFRPG
jgi:hypothetical protein